MWIVGEPAPDLSDIQPRFTKSPRAPVPVAAPPCCVLNKINKAANKCLHT